MWRMLDNQYIEFFIDEIVSLKGKTLNGNILGGEAYSEYSGLTWSWECESYVPPTEPVLGILSKTKLINSKWKIKNTNGLRENVITLSTNNILSSSLYGKGSWHIKDDKFIIIKTANDFVTYSIVLKDNDWDGTAKNNLGESWDLIIEQLIDREFDRLLSLYKVRKSDAEKISNYLNDIGITCFYHFTDASNIKSILESNGLYSWAYCKSKRIHICRPGGDELSHQLDSQYSLEDFVRLSFCKDHPMKYICIKTNRISNPVIIEISTEVALLESTIFSDINAADKNHETGNSLEFLKRINLAIRKKDYRYLSSTEKKQYQAEILVKSWVPKEYFLNLNSILKYSN